MLCLVSVAFADHICEERRRACRNSGIEYDDEKENWKRERQRGQSFRRYPPAEIGIHHVIHGVEKEADGYRHSHLPDQAFDRSLGKVVILHAPISIVKGSRSSYH